jgi:hypothetical protein
MIWKACRPRELIEFLGSGMVSSSCPLPGTLLTNRESYRETLKLKDYDCYLVLS